MTSVTPKRKDPFAVYYVYALVDPRDDQPFYIGKGKDSRPEAHLYEWRITAGLGCNKAKLARIGDIYDLGLEVAIKIIEEELAEPAALYRENAYLHAYKAILTNIQYGPPPALGSILLVPQEQWRPYESREQVPAYRGGPWRRAFHTIDDLVHRFRRPRSWKFLHLSTHGKLPSGADWDEYLMLYQEHIEMREHFRSKMLEEDAKTAKAKTQAA